MTLYITRRLLGGIGTLFVVTLFTMLIFFTLTPDPAASICGQTCSPERIESIRSMLGVDQPFFTQFWTYISSLFVGRNIGEGADMIHCAAPCLGYSFQTRQDVLGMIVSRLPVTQTLAVGAAILWLVAGVVSGVVSGLKAGTVWDKSMMIFALIGVALPNYLVALVLQYLLVVKLRWLPFPSNVSAFEEPVLWFQSYLMPWIVLALMFAALYSRLTRSNIIDTLDENFIRTARAKGLSRRVIVGRHALRPALSPVVTLFGIDFATLLGGAIITETVFGLNGVGKLAYDAIATNDQPVLMGITLLAGFAVVIANIIVDLVYHFLDPRVRRGA